MIENVSTQLTVFHCLCPLPASRKGLRLPLRSALFGEGGRDWRPWYRGMHIYYVKYGTDKSVVKNYFFFNFSTKTYVVGTQKNRLIGTVLLSAQNKCKNFWIGKIHNFTL